MKTDDTTTKGKIAIGNIVSQNNQQNALPNGLGGVSLQTYDYDAMNRLIHSSGGNSDAGVSYHFGQTYSPSGRIGDKFCDFTHSDHLGSSSWTTDENGYAVQHIEYLPFGEEFINQRTTSYEDRYTFTGKELDDESNLYYYDARYNSSTYSQFNSPDPMSDKLPNFNPYLYCAGNPIRFVDPTGMHPIYDTEGNLLGTDDKGLQGEAIIMKSGDFKQNMSSEVSLKNNLGIGKLYPEGKQKFDESYAGLSYRPDWDGKITFDEAKAWYQAGSGQPLYADFSQIEIHDFLINEKQLNKNKGLLCNLFFFSSDIESMCIYGTITLIKDENHPLNFIPNSDTYNFEMHHCTWKEPVECFRNILTKFGKNINGEGNPFKIHFYGLQTKNQLLLKIL